MNRRADVVWTVVLVGGGTAFTVYDLRCDRRKDESTFSCFTRRLVEAVPAGDVVFTLALAGAGFWFRNHILAPLAAAHHDAPGGVT